MINCVFSEPIDLEPDIKLFDWEFSKMVCSGDLDYSTSTFPAYLEKIEDSENSFFLEKNISYGDFLVVGFLILFFVAFIISGIREFAKNRKLERL